MMQYNKPYSFEKTDVRGLFYFNFFNRNVKSKHVCQLAYNVSAMRWRGLEAQKYQITQN